MESLKIRVYKLGMEQPKTVVTIPLSVLRMVSKLIPRRAKEMMEAEGINISEVAELAASREVKGVLMEIEEQDERVVISVE